MEKSDVLADATGNYTVMEENDGQADAGAKSDGLASKSDVDKYWSDPADSKMVEVRMVIKFLYIYIPNEFE